MFVHVQKPSMHVMTEVCKQKTARIFFQDLCFCSIFITAAASLLGAIHCGQAGRNEK